MAAIWFAGGYQRGDSGVGGVAVAMSGWAMTQPQFRNVLQFLASSPTGLDSIPGFEIPQHSQLLPHEYRAGENSLVSIALKYGDLMPAFAASDMNALPKEESILEELDSLLTLMLTSNDPNLWIWIGYQRIPSWKCVRRLAAIAVELLGWPRETLTAEELGELLG